MVEDISIALIGVAGSLAAALLPYLIDKDKKINLHIEEHIIAGALIMFLFITFVPFAKYAFGEHIVNGKSLAYTLQLFPVVLGVTIAYRKIILSSFQEIIILNCAMLVSVYIFGALNFFLINETKFGCFGLNGMVFFSGVTISLSYLLNYFSRINVPNFNMTCLYIAAFTFVADLTLDMFKYLVKIDDTIRHTIGFPIMLSSIFLSFIIGSLGSVKNLKCETYKSLLAFVIFTTFIAIMRKGLLNISVNKQINHSDFLYDFIGGLSWALMIPVFIYLYSDIIGKVNLNKPLKRSNDTAPFQ